MAIHPATINFCCFVLMLFIILNELGKTPPPT